MDVFESPYYRLNCNVQAFMGQWPYQNRTGKYFRRAIVILIMLSAELCLNAPVFTTEFTSEVIANFIPYTTLSAIACIHYYFGIHSERKVRKMLDQIKHDWKDINNVDECLILQNTTKEGRTYIYNSLALGQLGNIFVSVNGTQKAADSSIEILHKAYFSKWYYTSPSSQRLLVLIMMKSLKPSTVKVGSMFPCDLETYASVVKLCLSFFTGLCSINN